jgi:Zn-dependent protease
MLFDITLPTLISRIVVLLIAFSVHEFAHAWTADRFGDRTPRMNGRLTLNPISHLDPIGSLMLLFVGFGWAKPVPVNPYALGRHSSAAMMWVALAGPLSNFIMAVIASLAFRLGFVTLFAAIYNPGTVFPSIDKLFYEFIFINLLLMLFNLIPLAPLDGDKIADYFMPPSWSRFMDSIRPYGPMILMAILFLGPMMGLPIIRWIIIPPMTALFQLLVG